MFDQVDSIKEIGKSVFFFVRVVMKSPCAVKVWDIHWLFMTICGGFSKTHHKTPTKKGPFAEGIPVGLLVRFLWANKENEQHRMVKRRITK